MRANAVRTTMAAGRPVVNAWISSAGPYAAETLSYAGFDSVTVDVQHGMFGRGAVVGLLQAISAGPAMPMVRPSSLDAGQIGWLLDAGAYGIICPSVDTPRDAEALVAACRYPPRGSRSFGPSRGLLYGGSDYVARSDEILVWAMVESAASLAHLDEIVSTEGIDGVYVGPNDLALSMGETPGGRIRGRVRDALCHIVERAHVHGRFVGVFCVDGAEASDCVEIGCDLVTPGNDISMLKHEASRRIAAIRGGRESTSPTSGY
ncbi:HpcH/HpaI aldolase/citrate lyase family protein [uncultured Leifsonia sp.]|uniref:HpcH/HpaI aldolase family protein n=1 Tax=uncultured Leifsonia sp. TaxID=340359 RepID=UPI0025E61B11|nr:aldolase/citrate lyase family protein [uncultured Leifsonia sp.]